MIHGLNIIENFINDEEHSTLISEIDKSPWLTDLKRRVQHYGFKYDYSARRINPSMYVGCLPDWTQDIQKRLKEIVPHFAPDQLIINEYNPGQGISGHVDCETCFTNTIISLSLGSGCEIEFINCKTHTIHKYYIRQKSLLIFSDEARYNWKHRIRGRKTDMLNFVKIYRTRRVSLTFRKVILDESL